MNRRTFMALGASALLAGCTATVEEATEESEVVSDLSLVQRDGSLYVSVTLHENVEQNDEWCTTSWNPALRTNQTTCYDDWESVTINRVVFLEYTGILQAKTLDEVQGENLNGSTVEFPVSWSDGEYHLRFYSAGGYTTFGFTIEGDGSNAELTNPTWDDSY